MTNIKLQSLLRKALALVVWIPLAAPVFGAEVIYTATESKIMTFAPGTSVAAMRSAAEASGAKVLRELPLIDAVEVVPSATRMEVRLAAFSSKGIRSIEPNEYRKWIETVSPEALRAADPLAGASLGAARGGDVPEATEGEAKEGDNAATPDEKYFWGLKRVKAPGIWKQATGKGVKVAVIDTGIDYTHPDLASNYVGGYNALDPKKDPIDDHGHGTHVAGTIAGAGEKAVVGVAPRASLYAVKVLDADGGGSYASIIAGIQWAVENKMDIVNMSLGGPASPALQKAIQAAYKAGVTVVAAAGNDPEAPVSAPAMYEETICVSASTFDDKLAFFSTTGPEVDFIAPGHEIDSSWPGGKIARLSGTSMATPHMAGLAALAKQLGARGPDAIRSKLAQAAGLLPDLTADQQGAGLVEADRWVKALMASTK